MKIKFIPAIIICLLMSMSTQAQSWTDIFNKENISKVVSTVTGSASNVDITGTWGYTGSAVEFKSNDLLKQAGGVVASSMIENKLDQQLTKLGVTAGITQFTFSEDSTFTSTIGKRTLSGNYSYDAENQTVNLKYAGLVGINAKVNQSSNNMSLLFDADKLLQLLVLYGNKSTNTSIKAITTLAEGYDGMMLGLEFNK
ncbi:MAG: DUF4923 family protein [Bacteroides sp.]|nr:DUF4923 family protein [Bacteroides sp.]